MANEKVQPKDVDVEEFLTGGNLTPDAVAAGLTDDDVSGGSFVDPDDAAKKLAKYLNKKK